ncbi:MAG: Serine/threonine-protein kinase PknB [Planctomycetota bacterium]
MSFAQPFHDYEILERVGAGAMGTVFRARDRKLGRVVAIKVLKPSLARDERYVERLRREARIVAALNHPNIVAGFALGEEGGYHYFVMEYVEGESLRTLLQEWGVFPEERVLEVGIDVASALEHAWQRGVIHRDVKPGNVLIDASGRVKLTDMGLAKGPADLDLTRDGATLGTPQYISPEQARDPQKVDVRSDLWSLGATLYHMATGQVPFRGTTLAEVIAQVLYETPRPAREINPAISEGMELVLRKLLVRDPALRYQTPTDLLDDLRRVAVQQAPGIDARALVRAERGRPGSGMRKLAIVAASVCAGFVLALFAVEHWTQGAAVRVEDEVRQRFLADLDREIASAGTGADKWSALAGAAARAPQGAAAALEERRDGLRRSLRDAVDRAVRDIRSNWQGLEALLGRVDTWPARADLEREVVDPVLSSPAATGFRCADLPAELRTPALSQLLADIDQRIAQRDAVLEGQFDVRLRELGERAGELVSLGRLREAERTWQGALDRFGDGIEHPVPARWSAALRGRIEMKLEERRRPALERLQAEAGRLAAGLEREVAAAIRALEASPARSPRRALEDWRRLTTQLRDSYPDAQGFPEGMDPWPDLQPQLATKTRELEARVDADDESRSQSIARAAWDTFVGAADPATGAARALGLLEVGGQDQGLRTRLASHADLLQATAAAAAGAAAAPEERALGLHLLARLQARRTGAAVDVPPAPPAALVQYRAALDLFGEALAATRPVEVGLGEALAAATREHAAASAGGSLEGLAAALQSLEPAAAQLDPGQRAVMDQLGAWLARERQRREVLARLRAAAPGAASCSVEYEGERLDATMLVPAAGLAAGAGTGWQLQRGDGDALLALERVSDPVAQRLETGLALAEPVASVGAVVELVVPQEGSVRAWLFSLRGQGVLVALDARGRVRAAPARSTDPSNRAAMEALLLRALEPVVAPTKGEQPPLVVPGAVHRIELVVRAATGRTRGEVVLRFEGSVVCSTPVDLDGAQLPTFTIHPFAPLSVRSVQLAAEGI